MYVCDSALRFCTAKRLALYGSCPLPLLLLNLSRNVCSGLFPSLKAAFFKAWRWVDPIPQRRQGNSIGRLCRLAVSMPVPQNWKSGALVFPTFHAGLCVLLFQLSLQIYGSWEMTQISNFFTTEIDTLKGTNPQRSKFCPAGSWDQTNEMQTWNWRFRFKMCDLKKKIWNKNDCLHSFEPFMCLDL